VGEGIETFINLKKIFIGLKWGMDDTFMKEN
jgi:hypothetical protein